MLFQAAEGWDGKEGKRDGFDVMGYESRRDGDGDGDGDGDDVIRSHAMRLGWDFVGADRSCYSRPRKGGMGREVGWMWCDWIRLGGMG